MNLRQFYIERGLIVPAGSGIPLLRMQPDDHEAASRHMAEYYNFRLLTGEEEMDWIDNDLSDLN